MKNYLQPLTFTPEGTYETPISDGALVYKKLPSFFFYLRLIDVVITGSNVAKRGGYTRQQWIHDSMRVIRGLERAGVILNITGINNIKDTPSPVVFIGNHMSMLETTVLPGIIAPIKPVTFVIKESLVRYPLFKHIMIATNPITVTRTNPREDFKKVISEGTQMIKQGISVIVFPQTTRTVSFNPEEFNTIGIKLAKNAQVPVIPIALKTDAWQNGKLIKDLGKLIPKMKVYFSFGTPLYIKDRGNEEHKQVIEFIQNNLKRWGGS
ncbi:MAG: 1-acyl-sn-glycerol-3-phosphate acyltransferase [Thermodesulfovibrionales bacterium]|nr:1-acyl-sn-glycerol-3-phosphate acyltransferase [Thermodesulfovibrionales bacterium]